MLTGGDKLRAAQSRAEIEVEVLWPPGGLTQAWLMLGVAGRDASDRISTALVGRLPPEILRFAADRFRPPSWPD
jgi:hypothetical protein